jgi:hypothetical protein
LLSSAAHHAWSLLAAADEGPDPERVTPGLLGFTVVALLALALWFLLRSMTRRLRNVKFDEQRSEARGEPSAGDSDDGPETRR